MTPAEVSELERVLIDWLPARDFSYDRNSFRSMLELYATMDTEALRANLIAFLA